MTEVIKKVLRKKKVLLFSHLDVTNRLLDGLEEDGILDETVVEEIKGILTNNDRLTRLLEGAFLSMSDEQLLLFMKSIQKYNQLVYEELNAEIMAENGSLKIEEYIMVESATAVHRKFGASRRFSEADKKAITEMLAVKTQTTKEVWRVRLDRISRDIEQLQAKESDRMKASTECNKKINNFIRQNEFQLFEYVHDMRSTTQVLLKMNDSTREMNDFTKLLDKVESLLSRFSRILIEKEAYNMDREKCFRILKCVDFKKPISHMLHNYIRTTDREKDERERTVKYLKRQVIDLEEQLNEREREVDVLQTEVKVLREKWETLKDGVPEEFLVPIETSRSRNSSIAGKLEITPLRKDVYRKEENSHVLRQRPQVVSSFTTPIARPYRMGSSA